MTTLLRATFAACALAALPVVAADARDVPPPPATYVLDEADWLDAAEEARLAQALLHFERESSNQIVVAVFRTLDGEDLADFSQRVAEGWHVGQAEKDNGVLLAVFVEERLVDIEVGYGLEPVVTDAVASRIRSEILAPAFREGRYADGLFAAVDALKSAARGEFRGTGQAQSDGFPLRALLLMLLAFVILSAIVGRLGAAHGPVIFGPPGWGSSGRVFRAPRGGGFGGGGSRGGSFRGGGGSFGGGGARGSW